MLDERLIRYRNLVQLWMDPQIVYTEICKHNMFFTRDILISTYGITTYGAVKLINALVNKNILRLISPQEYIKYSSISMQKHIYVLTDDVLCSVCKNKKEEVIQPNVSVYEKTFYLVSSEVVSRIKKFMEIQKEFSSELTLQPILLYTSNKSDYKKSDKVPLVFSETITSEMSKFGISDWQTICSYIQKEIDTIFPHCTHSVCVSINLYPNNNTMVNIYFI